MPDLCEVVAIRLERDGFHDEAEHLRRRHAEGTAHITGGTFPREEGEDADEGR